MKRVSCTPSECTLIRYDLVLFRFMPVLAVTSTARALPDVGRHYYDPNARGAGQRRVGGEEAVLGAPKERKRELK